MEQLTQEILTILKDRPGLRFISHKCTFCKYPCGWFANIPGKLHYDSGCDCVIAYVNRLISEANLDRYIKANADNAAVKKKIAEFIEQNKGE